MVTIAQLQYVIAIDTYRNFGIAAEKSMVTQPTLSMQVKKLELELDIVLFDRSKTPIVPTNIGVAFIEQARIIIRETQKLDELVNDFKEILGGTLKIGIIPTIAPYLLPYFLGPFSKMYPEIKLNIKELKTEEIVDLLQKDLLDAGILATPLHEPKIFESPLFYEEILLYINPSHPLAKQTEVAPNQLEDEDMWMLTKGNCFRDHVINLCATRTEQPLHNLRYESGSLETLKKMVDVEGGYTLLPELAALELPSKDLKRIRHFIEPKPLREVSLVYARKAAKQKLLQYLVSSITKELPESILDKSRGHLVHWK